MKYLPTAFAQLAFSWKLYNYALEGKIELEALDIPITFQEEDIVFVLPDRIFDSPDDLIIALENNLSVNFGAAAITLNRSREEAGLTLPDPIECERDQFIALTYQLRNAFAHDISEPRWATKRDRYKRVYEFGGMRVDLSNIDEKHFEYSDIGGPDMLFHMKDYAEQNQWWRPSDD